MIVKYSAILFTFLMISGFTWGSSPVGEHGDKFEEKEVIPIGEIVANPDKYLGKMVAVKGTLFDVCQEMACWFSIKDKTGAIYIDLYMGIKFTIPKNSNDYQAIVYGKVTNEKGRSTLKLRGKGVKILEE